MAENKKRISNKDQLWLMRQVKSGFMTIDEAVSWNESKELELRMEYDPCEQNTGNKKNFHGNETRSLKSTGFFRISRAKNFIINKRSPQKKFQFESQADYEFSNEQGSSGKYQAYNFSVFYQRKNKPSQRKILQIHIATTSGCFSTTLQIDFERKIISMIDRGNIFETYKFRSIVNVEGQQEAKKVFIHFNDNRPAEFLMETLSDKIKLMRLLHVVIEQNDCEKLSVAFDSYEQLQQSFTVIKEGLLYKQESFGSYTWIKRQVTIRPGELAYHRVVEDEDSSALNVIRLAPNIITITIVDKTMFTLTIQNTSYQFKVVDDSRYQEEIRNEWIRAIETAGCRDYLSNKCFNQVQIRLETENDNKKQLHVLSSSLQKIHKEVERYRRENREAAAEAKLKINSIILLLQDLQRINHPKRDKKNTLHHLFAKRKVQDVEMTMTIDRKSFVRNTRYSIRNFEENDKITSFVDHVYQEPDCEVHEKRYENCTSDFTDAYRVPEVIYEELDLNRDQIKPCLSDKKITDASKESIYEVITDNRKEEEMKTSPLSEPPLSLIPPPPKTLNEIPNAPTMTSKKPPKKKQTMRVFHCIPVPNDQIEKSLWIHLHDVSELIDVAKIKEEFSVKANKKMKKNQLEVTAATNVKSSTGRTGRVTYLDQKTAQNLGIFLSGFNFRGQRLVEKISKVREEDGGLLGDQVDSLSKFCPEPELKKLYERHTEKPEVLSKEDRFMMELSTIPKLNMRLDILKHLRDLPQEIEVLEPELSIVSTALNELLSSKLFEEFLAYLMAVTNTINSCNNKGEAKGIRMASLEQTYMMRTNDRKKNLLQVIIEIISAKSPYILKLPEELSNVQKAKSYSVRGLSAEFDVMRKSLYNVRKNSEYLKRKSKELGKEISNFCKEVEIAVVEQDKALEKVNKHLKEVNKLQDEVLIKFGEAPETQTQELFQWIHSFLLNFQKYSKEQKLLH